jgi:hypothetical protein
LSSEARGAVAVGAGAVDRAPSLRVRVGCLCRVEFRETEDVSETEHLDDSAGLVAHVDDSKLAVLHLE